MDDGGEGGDANAQRGERLAGVGAVDESEDGGDGDYRFHGGVGVVLCGWVRDAASHAEGRGMVPGGRVYIIWRITKLASLNHCLSRLRTWRIDVI